MRSKHTPKRGGDTGKGGGSPTSSNDDTPKKDSKPDKSTGLANHIFTCGKLEDFQKTYEYCHEHRMTDQLECCKNAKVHTR